MKIIISIIGTILNIFCIIGFSYKYFSYTTTEKVAEVGPVKVTTENQKIIPVSPTVSAIILGTGIILVIIGLSRKI